MVAKSEHLLSFPTQNLNRKINLYLILKVSRDAKTSEVNNLKNKPRQK